MYNDLNFGFMFLTQRLGNSAQLVHLWCSYGVLSGSWQWWSVNCLGHHEMSQASMCVYNISLYNERYKPQPGCMCQISFWLTQFFCFAVSIFIGNGYKKKACNDDTFIAVCSMSVLACSMIFKFLYRIGNHNSFSSHT